MGIYGGPAPVDWSTMIGRRLLLRIPGALWVFEATLREISPSGQYLRFDTGWEPVGNAIVVEVLPSVIVEVCPDER